MITTKIKYLRIEIPILYGDSQVPYDFPFRINERWNITIDIEKKQIINWPIGKYYKIKLMVGQSGSYYLLDENDNNILSIRKNAVPNKLIPGISLKPGYFLNLDIAHNGVIKNWIDEISYDEFYPSDTYSREMKHVCDNWKADLYISLLMGDGGDAYSEEEIEEAYGFIKDNKIFTITGIKDLPDNRKECSFKVNDIPNIDPCDANPYRTKPYGSYILSLNTKIKEINNQLFENYGFKGAKDLSDWINSFDSTFFIPLTGKTCLITTGDMINYILKWFDQFELLGKVINLDTEEQVSVNYELEDIDLQINSYKSYDAVKLLLYTSVEEINKTVFRPEKNMGTMDLKEWIEEYESTRITQLDANTIIITSVYNMEYVLDWLKFYTKSKKFILRIHEND